MPTRLEHELQIDTLCMVFVLFISREAAEDLQKDLENSVASLAFRTL